MGSFLIVGGSSDIGQILCRSLVAKGHLVCATGRDNSRMNDLQAIGVTTLIGDATNEEFIDGAVNNFMTINSGKLDGVAHLVGSISIRPPHAMKVADFEQVLSTNLTSAFLVLSKSCKYMLRNGGGRLVFTSSVAAGVGLTNHEAISAAKGGLESMARSAAATYSKRGIRVNTVAPGLTDTRLASPITKTESSKEAAVSKIPLNRINEPDEIAKAIEWLLTEAPDNLTGQVLNLDGGMSSLR